MKTANPTGKQRLWIVIAAAWILFVLFNTEPWEYSNLGDYGPWMGFLVFGIGPVAVVLAFIWVRRGFQNDKANEHAANNNDRF